MIIYSNEDVTAIEIALNKALTMTERQFYTCYKRLLQLLSCCNYLKDNNLPLLCVESQ